MFASITVVMLLASTFSTSVFGAATYTNELADAYDYAYGIGITTMDSIDGANMYGSVTRAALAKMMSVYAMDVLGQEPDTSADCNFSDVNSSLGDLADYATTACQLGIMGQGIDKFMPYNTVDRATFGTVMSRVLWGDANNSDGADWYSAHLSALKDAGVMTNISNPMQPEVRGYVMLMMQRADEDNVADATPAECQDPMVQLSCALGLDDCPAVCTDTEEEDVVDEVVTSDGALEISLNSRTADAASIAKNANSVEFMTFDIDATDDDVTIDSITLERQGLGDRTDFLKVWLTDENNVIISNDKSISSNDTVELTVNIDINKGDTATFNVVASMNNVANKLNNFAVVDVQANTNDINGLPVEGETMETVDYSVAELTFTAKGADTTVDLGSEGVTVGEFKLEETGSSKKDVIVRSLRLKASGGVKLSNLSNFELMMDGDDVAEDVVIDGDYITFVLDDLVIEDAKSKIFTIKADADSGDNGDTFTLTLKDTFDISSIEEGTNMGASVVGNGTALKVYTLNAGKLTLSLDTSTPASEEYVADTDDVLVMVAKVDTDQDVSVDTIRVYLHPDTTDLTEANFEAYFENWKLVVNGKTLDSQDDLTDVNTDGNATVGDNTDEYLEFDVSTELSDNDLIEVYTKITSSAADNTVVKLTMDNSGTSDGYSDVLRDVEYVSDGETVAQAKMTGTATSNTITVVDSATGVTIVRNDGYDTNTTFLAGEQEAALLKFVVNAGNSSSLDIRKLNFDLDATNSLYTNYTNVKVLIDGEQEGTTEDFAENTSPDGTLTIEDINYVVPKNGQVTVELVANIDTSTTAEPSGSIDVTLDVSDSLFYDNNSNEITVAGGDVASAAFVVASSASLTVAVDGDTPVSALLVAGTDDIEVAKFKFTATDGEVKIKDLYFENINAAASDARISSYDLVVDGETLDSRVPSSDRLHFDLGSSNAVVVPKDDNIVVTLVANLNTITDAAQTNSIIEMSLTDLVADTAVTSTALTVVNGATAIDDTSGDAGDHYDDGNTPVANLNLDAEVMYVRKTQPTVTLVDLGATKLVAGEQSVYKASISADSAEDVEVGSITFNVTDGTTNGIGGYKLFVNGNEKLAAEYTLTAALPAITFDFDYDQAEIVAAGSSKTFELKLTPSGALVDNDYVSTKIVEDDTVIVAGTYDADSDNTFDNATDVRALDANATFIWSDNAGSPHDNTTVDWFNGVKVNGLDTTSATLEK